MLLWPFFRVQELHCIEFRRDRPVTHYFACLFGDVDVLSLFIQAWISEVRRLYWSCLLLQLVSTRGKGKGDH